ncbi:MAG TPA: 2-C-methyl-D-erythritol 2,4-cyclodiphosphate synthase [Thermoanaerobaculia bacterium]|nr:2-C-methyl-D-erythritol 2,4-cyclodiphosphate synthase [Thermoanaerobaculia bacterium]
MSGRVGLGFDAHPFAAGRPMRLGGIEIPYNRGLRGHSDGDALLHAIADAILGAAGLGSLGQQFPDNDAKWRGADSGVFVKRAREMADERGFAVGNVDAVVIAEAPKIAPFAAKIQARVAELLGVAAESVSVRGTSTNGLGFVGRTEGLAVMAVVMLVPK